MHEVTIPGPEGRLEARYNEGNGKSPPLAILLHPHPKFGGNMNNKVIYNCFKTFTSMGFSVLRFNYRGVGKSEGEYSGEEGIGEMTDSACALDWLLLNNAESTKVWVVGFSFGAFIALNLLMRRPEIQNFIAISPPADKYDFSFLAPCPVSGMIMQGDNDDIVNEIYIKNKDIIIKNIYNKIFNVEIDDIKMKDVIDISNINCLYNI